MVLLGSLLCVLTGLFACSDNATATTWCDSRTVAQIFALQGDAPSSNWCATVHGSLLYRKDATRCRQGAFYLADSTDTIFVCDPNKPASVVDSGVVACNSDVLKFASDTTLQVTVKAQGLYYPAKNICTVMSFCWCQNGLEVDQLQKEAQP